MRLDIRGNNLYRNGKLLELGDETILYRDKLVITPREEDTYHAVGLEDELTIIAYRYYKDIVADASKYWWVIADANNIQNPMDISSYVGKEVLIPSILDILTLLE